jgi:type I restriction enzyme S subunit
MSNNKIPLKDLCIEDEWGKYGIPASAEDYDISKTRYLRITDISDDGALLNNDKKSVTADEIEKYVLAEGDIVFARTGNSTGRTYYHESKNGKLAFAGFLIRYALDKKKVNPKYLKFYTVSNEYKKWVKNLSVGSTRGNINAQTFANCPVTVPDRKQQDLLVTTLSLLTDKIELNQRINAELESMAKTLYDYWFVQFDFPNPSTGSGCAGKPYKTSGGKMVWNDALKREIPLGWDVEELSDIANITMGQSPPGDSYNNEGEGKIFFQGCTDFGTRFPSVRLFTTQPTRFAKAGDILLSVRAPVGTINIAKEDCCIGRGLAALNSKNNTITYLLEVMRNQKQVFDRRNVNGTTFGSITKDDLFSLMVLKPEDKILEQYQKKIYPTFEKQNKLELESQTLTELRDWLLPMLMNGQVKVNIRNS